MTVEPAARNTSMLAVFADPVAPELARSLDIELWAWTVDHPAQWDRLAGLGATDAWCTNDPRALRAWLDDRSA